MTDRLYLQDPTMSRASAQVVAIDPRGIVLDRSPFYPRGGGQPGDCGRILWDNRDVAVLEAIRGEDADVVLPLAGEAPLVGAVVTAEVDWVRRLAHMRMHTTLHLLCSVLPGASVTGGQIGAEKSRLDFDLPAAPDAHAIEAQLAALVAADHPVTTEWVDESVLDTTPELVRTLSVRPPRGAGRLRLVRIGGSSAVDLQPCGGTHVASTGQIGKVKVMKIENKGRQNRRITVVLGD